MATGRRTHQAAVTLFGPVRAQVIEAIAGQDAPVEDSLLFLREVVDALRDAPLGGPQDPATAGVAAAAGNANVRQPPGE